MDISNELRDTFSSEELYELRKSLAKIFISVVYANSKEGSASLDEAVCADSMNALFDILEGAYKENS